MRSVATWLVLSHRDPCRARHHCGSWEALDLHLRARDDYASPQVATCDLDGPFPPSGGERRGQPATPGWERMVAPWTWHELLATQRGPQNL